MPGYSTRLCSRVRKMAVASPKSVTLVAVGVGDAFDESVEA